MLSMSYRSPKTEVRASPIHGRGLFAIGALRRGEIVAVKGGCVMQGEQWRELEPVLGAAEIQVAEDLFIAPDAVERRDAAMLYTNHSCDPNIAIQDRWCSWPCVISRPARS